MKRTFLVGLTGWDLKTLQGLFFQLNDTDYSTPTDNPGVVVSKWLTRQTSVEHCDPQLNHVTHAAFMVFFPADVASCMDTCGLNVVMRRSERYSDGAGYLLTGTVHDFFSSRSDIRQVDNELHECKTILKAKGFRHA